MTGDNPIQLQLQILEGERLIEREKRLKASPPSESVTHDLLFGASRNFGNIRLMMAKGGGRPGGGR